MLFRRKSHTPFNERVLGFKSHAFYAGGAGLTAFYVLVFGVVGQVSTGVNLARASVDDNFKAELIRTYEESPETLAFLDKEPPKNKNTNELDSVLKDHNRREVAAKPKPKPPETLDDVLKRDFPQETKLYNDKEKAAKAAKSEEEKQLHEKIYTAKSDFLVKWNALERLKKHDLPIREKWLSDSKATYESQPSDTTRRNLESSEKHLKIIQDKIAAAEPITRSLAIQVKALEKQLSELQTAPQKQTVLSLQLSPEDEAKFNQTLNK